MIALTATATKATRQSIFEVLMMANPHVIYESPNKNNIAYAVEYMPTMDADLDHYFGWLGEELREKKNFVIEPSFIARQLNNMVWCMPL